MSYAKLLDILGTFDRARWTKCKSHVESRYRIDTKERVLFNHLSRHKKKLYQEELSRDAIFLLLFPGGKSSSFSNLTSRMCKSIEDFLVIDEMTTEAYRWDRQMVLLKYYKKVGLSKYFLQESTYLIEEQQDLSDYNISKRLRLFLTQMEVGFSDLDVSIRTPFFFQAQQDLDAYWNNMQLLFSTEKSNRKVLYSETRDEEDPPSENLLFRFLTELNQLVVHRDENSYKRVKEELFVIYPMMSDKLAEITLIYLFNYCWYKIKQGDKPAQFELLDLYERGVDTKILLKNGLLSESQFLSIIEIKANLHPDTDHGEFIDQWFEKTETKYPTIVNSIAWAYVYFGRGDYHSALEQLEGQEHRSVNMNLSLRTRWMSICCLWAVDRDRQHFDVVLHSYERYFRRKKDKISAMNYKGSLNLLKTLRMFSEEKELTYIAAKVEGFEFLIFRNWIEKMIYLHQ